MANANAILIRNSKKYKPPTAANLAHNSAVNKATYWLNSGDKISQSKRYKNTHEVNEDWNKWNAQAKERYKNKNNRELRSDATIIEEGMIVIGSDVKLSKKDILKLTKDFIKKFEKDNNTKVLHWAYHDHEGTSDQINRHVHFLFSNVSNSGEMVRRNWGKSYLKQLQDDIFNISRTYSQNIDRGKESEYELIEIDGRLVACNTRKHKHHRIFREEKENESLARISIDVNNWSHSKLEKELKAIIAKQRKELKDQKAKRADYAELEAEHNILKQKLYENSLTIEDLKAQNAKEIKVKEHYRAVVELKEIQIEEQTTEIERLKTLINELKTQKEEQAKKILELEKKMLSRQDMNDYEQKKIRLPSQV